MTHLTNSTGLALLLAVLIWPTAALAEQPSWRDQDMGCDSPSFQNLPEDGDTLAPMAMYGLVVPFGMRNLTLAEIDDAIMQGTIALEVFDSEGTAVVGMLELEYDDERLFVWRPLQNVAANATYTVQLTIDWPNLQFSACGEVPEQAEVRTWTMPVVDLPMLEPLTPDDFFVTRYEIEERMTCCEDGSCVPDHHYHQASVEASVMLGERAGGFLRHQARFFIEGGTFDQGSPSGLGVPYEVLLWSRTMTAIERTGRLCVEIETRDALFDRSVVGEPVCLTWDEVGPEPAPIDPVPEDFCEGQVVELDVMEPVETDPDPDPDVADPAPSTPDADATSGPDGATTAEDESGIVTQDDGGTDCACAVRGGQRRSSRLPLGMGLFALMAGLVWRRRRRV